VSASLPARRTLVVATSNRGKLHEFRELFADLPIDLKPMAEALPRKIEIVEDQRTFEGNARKKARLVAEACAMPVLADDSGLEVDALDGAPGVRSARYAGEGATDSQNNRKLLTALQEMGEAPRTARFRCVIVLHDPIALAEPLIADGTCEGEIATGPRGAHGFGYDPIFIVRDVPGRRTMAELSDDEKNTISHRGRAVHAMRSRLRAWLGIPG
jgi:XTP/dITP diphosphohydrolase